MARHFVRRQVFNDLLAYIHDELGFRFTVTNRAALEAKLTNIRLPPQWPDLDAHQYRPVLARGRD